MRLCLMAALAASTMVVSACSPAEPKPVKHLPDKDTVMELKLALAELKGTVSTLGETVGSVSRTVHRIDDYLRQKADA
ncbi:hypothetical protein MZK49_06905 [Ensifer sesbaniae]|uniref:hypothetical protein n=1 Tax=Ensifer sesbaniae TaxID=1214071 RepID=UPI0020015687|nr:hypothetical protein [Ensifer sesbaniae]